MFAYPLCRTESPKGNIKYGANIRWRRAYSLAVLFFISIVSLGVCGRAATAAPSVLPVTWANPNPSESGLVRAIGDASIWSFTISLEPGLEFVGTPTWAYPKAEGADPEWGIWNEAGLTLTWSSPDSGGVFMLGISGRIRKTGGSGGSGTAEKDFNATWSGEVPCDNEPEILSHTAAIFGGNWTCGENGLTFDSTPGSVTIRITECDGTITDKEMTTDWVIADIVVGPNDEDRVLLVEMAEDGTVLGERTEDPGLCCG